MFGLVSWPVGMMMFGMKTFADFIAVTCRINHYATNEQILINYNYI